MKRRILSHSLKVIAPLLIAVGAYLGFFHQFENQVAAPTTNTETVVVKEKKAIASNITPSRPEILREREVPQSEVNAWLVNGRTPKPGETFTLKFFDDVVFNIETNVVRDLAQTQLDGRSSKDGLLDTVVVAKDGHLNIAVVNDYRVGRNYEMGYNLNDGKYYAREIDESLLPQPGPALTPPQHVLDAIAKKEAERNRYSDTPVADRITDSTIKEDLSDMTFSSAVASDSSRIINLDLLVVYDDRAETAMKNYTGGIEAHATAIIGIINRDLTNTKIDNCLVRLVGYEVSTNKFAANGDLEADLNSITSGAASGEIGTWRNKYGADIVSLYPEPTTTTGMAGIGWAAQGSLNQGIGYHVVWWRSSLSSTSTHEFGHNVGCGHSRDQSVQTGPQFYPYSSGAYNDAAGLSSLMAYTDRGNGQTYRRAPILSGPNSVVSGATIGDAMNDNARTWRENMEGVSNYREETALSVRPDSWSVPLSGGQQSFSITSINAWTVTSEPENPDWLTFDPKSGEAGTGLQVDATATANESTTPRSVRLIVTAGKIQKQIAITQVGKLPELNLSESEYVYSNKGEEKKITVTSNATWSARYPESDSWVTVSPSGNAGAQSCEVVIAVSSNLTTARRTSTVTFTAGSVKKTFTIIQKGSEAGVEFYENLVSENTKISNLELNSSSIEKTILVSSNVPWTATAGDGVKWFSILSGASGKASGTIEMKIKVLENIKIDSRNSEIIFTSGGKKIDTLPITQSGATPDLYITGNNVIKKSAIESSVLCSSNGGQFEFMIIDNQLEGVLIKEEESYLSAEIENKKLTVNISPNPTANPRTPYLKLRHGDVEHMILFSQAGGVINVTTEPNGAQSYQPSVSADGEKNKTISVKDLNAGTKWTVKSDVDWIIIDSFDVGNGFVSYTVAKNITTISREGNLVFYVNGDATTSFKVSQNPAKAWLKLIPDINKPIGFGFNGNSIIITVDSNTNQWIASIESDINNVFTVERINTNQVRVTAKENLINKINKANLVFRYNFQVSDEPLKTCDLVQSANKDSEYDNSSPEKTAPEIKLDKDVVYLPLAKSSVNIKLTVANATDLSWKASVDSVNAGSVKLTKSNSSGIGSVDSLVIDVNELPYEKTNAGYAASTVTFVSNKDSRFTATLKIIRLITVEELAIKDDRTNGVAKQFIDAYDAWTAVNDIVNDFNTGAPSSFMKYLGLLPEDSDTYLLSAIGETVYFPIYDSIVAEDIYICGAWVKANIEQGRLIFTAEANTSESVRSIKVYVNVSGKLILLVFNQGIQ